MGYDGVYLNPSLDAQDPDWKPTTWDHSISYVDMKDIEAKYTIEIPENFLREHRLHEDGLEGKSRVELCGARLKDGEVVFDYMFPRDRYRHAYYVVPVLLELVKVILPV